MECLAPRTRKHFFARKPYAFLLIAACYAVFGLSSFSTRVVRSQGETGVPRSLSLGERVAYQRAVDEVYWRHTVWPKENSAPKPTLDEVMSLDATRAKVEDILRKSDALARLWNRPVSAAQPQAEMTRMARETRRPEVV